MPEDKVTSEGGGGKWTPGEWRRELAKARVGAILDAMAECEVYSERAREHAITFLDDAIGDKFRCRAEGADDVRNRLRVALALAEGGQS